MTAKVKCPYCDRQASLVKGKSIYPDRPDLLHLNFWRCAHCDAHVGTHKKNRRLGYDGTEPMGRLANAELRRLKIAAHNAFDPLWKSGTMDRNEAYAWLAKRLGISVRNCHIGMFDVDGCKSVMAAVAAHRANRSLFQPSL
jgi:hypothetical protein